ncbi:SpaA isopeptide-forming pilin-related protein [Paenibacillus sp. B1-33]|uniref:SpaA isopeptide-forming pilin-related protein n=1 Tax=unclassified Paenibacillus TaxID=185978 RepID=UPI003D280DBF
MNYLRKTLYGLFIVAIMLNLVLPPTLVQAYDGLPNTFFNTGDRNVASVTDLTYGKDPNSGKDPSSVTKVTYGAITDNILASVSITDAKGNNISSIRPNLNEYVKIDYTWKLPAGHHYGAGSTFTFQLPDKFQLSAPITNQPLNKGGIEYGTFDITPNGQVTFTFNDEIEDGQELVGDFFVWRYFDEKKFEGGTQQEIIFDIQGDSSFEIPIHFNKNPNSKEITKRGTANRTINPTEIEWVVDFNTSEGNMNNAVFTDMLPDGLEIDMSSITVHKLDVQLNGTVKEAEKVAYLPVREANGFKIELGNIHNAYRVKYNTKITKTEDKRYTNAVQITGDNHKPLTISSNVDVRFSKPLEKQSTGYASSTQTINWKIEYNYNEREIEQANAWIADVFDTSVQELNEDSFVVNEMSIDDNGYATVVRKVGKDEYTVVKTTDGFKLQFKDKVMKAYSIEYSTKSINRVYENGTIKNKVTIHDNTSKEASKDIYPVIFFKGHERIDYAKKTIDWYLSLNQDNKVMENITIEDTFKTNGLTINQQSLEDSLKAAGFTKDKDYTINYVADPTNTRYHSGFTITFKTNITSSLVIRYQTAFDPVLNNASYTNGANLNWKENNKDMKPIYKEDTVTPDGYTKNNGNKTGKYDARSKEITWTIDINYNLHHIGQAVLRDFYTGEQTFVDGSLTVRELILSGGANGVQEGSTINDYTIEKKTENNKSGFELTFNNPINKAYRITYKTSLKNQSVVKTYSNGATLEDKSTSKKVFDGKASVTPKYGDEYVSKTGVQGKGEKSDIAFWTVNINRSQSHIKAGSVLTDTLSSSQKLVPESIKLYKTTVSQNGTLTKASTPMDLEQIAEWKTEGNKLTLTFKTELDKAYVLEYQSFIDADNGENVSNKVSFEGQSSGTVNGNGSSSIKVEFAGAGGGASTSSRGKLKVQKVDTATAALLEGAKFGLYDKSGTILLQEAETDKDGIATFTDLRFRQYKVKEMAPPPGYLLPQKPEQVITLSKDGQVVTIKNTKIVRDYELTKVDAENRSKLLEGAVFKLQRFDGVGYADVVGYTNLPTKKNGKLKLTDLPPGQYKLVEVQAPAGYKQEDKEIPFTIDENQIVQKTGTVTNNRIKGSVELTKADDNKPASPLAGAEFELQDRKTGKVVRNKLITGIDGKVSAGNLDIGSYQFVEKAAPKGYKLNATPLKFDIIDSTKIELTFKNEKFPGSLKLLKIETGKTDKRLKGAQFRLLDENQQPLLDKDGKPFSIQTTDKNGLILIPNLKAGTYYIEEIKAPTGYLIDKKLTMFTITSEQETFVTVENSREPLPGSLKLLKIETGKADKGLEGAQFRLLDENQQLLLDKDGKPFSIQTTDKNGLILIPNLKAGTYYIEEIKAPDGYLIDKKLTMFTIASEQEALVTIENALKPIEPIDQEQPIDPKPHVDEEKPKEPTRNENEKPIKPEEPSKPEKPEDNSIPGHIIDGSDKEPGQETGKETGDKPNKETDTGNQPDDKPGNNEDSGKKPGNNSDNDSGSTKGDNPSSNNGSKDKSKDKETSDKVKDKSVSDQINTREPNRKQDKPGKVLPKTGEDSPLPMQLAGLALVMLGSVLFAIRKKWMKS